ncbi:MAG: SMC-Scp complex subunit ScpB, partial [Parvibaculum sp.]
MTDAPETGIDETEVEIDAQITDEPGDEEDFAPDTDFATSDEDEASDDEGEDDDAPSAEVVKFPANATDHAQLMRMAEALLFAATEPLDIDSIASRLPEGTDVGAVIEDLQTLYEPRGVNLVRVANKWMFRT